MTYVVPKNVVVQMGTVDADTLCGMPCSYYLDFNNFVNVPDNLGGVDTTNAPPGAVLTVDEDGNSVWVLPNSYIDGGAANSIFYLNSERNIDGVSASTIYPPGNTLIGGGA